LRGVDNSLKHLKGLREGSNRSPETLKELDEAIARGEAVRDRLRETLGK